MGNSTSKTKMSPEEFIELMKEYVEIIYEKDSK